MTLSILEVFFNLNTNIGGTTEIPSLAYKLLRLYFKDGIFFMLKIKLKGEEIPKSIKCNRVKCTNNKGLRSSEIDDKTTSNFRGRMFLVYG